MTENAEVQGESPDSSVIADLREQVKRLKADAREAEARVERRYTAKSLMPAELEGLTPYLVQEVEGELTQEKVNEWLAEKGVAPATPSNEAPEAEQSDASSVADVADLGSAVAAASNVTPEASLQKSLAQISEDFQTRDPGSLPELTARLAEITNPPE